MKKFRFVEELSLGALTEFRMTWKDGPLSSGKKLERLRSVCEFATLRHLMERNFAAGLKAPKANFVPTKPFSDDDIENILEAAQQSKRYAHRETHAFILMMRYSGLRISDVTILQRNSLVGNRMHLYTAKTGEPVSMLLPRSVVAALRISR